MSEDTKSSIQGALVMKPLSSDDRKPSSLRRLQPPFPPASASSSRAPTCSSKCRRPSTPPS
ncbi:hypothetical protein SO802_007064, partial [Lithocarpus litseifolius]